LITSLGYAKHKKQQT